MDASIRTRPLDRPARSVAGLLALLRRWTERRQQRRHLAALPDHLLRDIGVAPADVRLELSKPFWRV